MGRKRSLPPILGHLARLPGLATASLAILLGACSAIEPPATVTPSATIVPSPTVVPTPTLSAELSPLTVREVGGQSREVLGFLENTGDDPVTDIQLQVALFNEAGELIDAALFGPLYQPLAPGERSPFRVALPAGELVSESLLEIVSYKPSDPAPDRPQVELLQRSVTGEGDVIMLGQVLTVAPFRLDTVVAIATGSNGAPRAWMEADELGSLGTSQAPAMFSLRVPAEFVEDDVGLYPIGEAISPPPESALEFSLAPSLVLASQGNPYLLGEVHNPSSGASTGRILLRILRGEDLVEFHSLAIPMPVPPGSTLAFSVDNLPIVDALQAQDPSALEDLALEFELEPLGSETGRRTAMLQSEVLEVEAIGSSAFLRARISNNGTEAANQPTVFAAVRSTRGVLHTAAWASPVEVLEPAQSADALIQLPLPPGLDLFRAEFDIWAAGWSPSPP